ncbi:hemerythrin domain-containing protein [Neorhizobium sp. T786]|uniref:hemerythrin domain-containing protein n=1 Tax=Pseudorhizobium xiangyangii TaxID=2883104 RepID=UPI001CFFF26F|nr:hemerythrin domain-containing protein [Neorhizobium xiangyangii]MCB5200988.1 hemerythrin domain-containing protein [Neorhizobium xiangyangii]
MNNGQQDENFSSVCRVPDAEMIAWLHNAHSQQLALCDELEEIADSLPVNVNRQKCIYAAKALVPMIRTLHHYEETVLFPRVHRQNGGHDNSEILSRLRYEHLEDEGYAEELTETLLKLGSGVSVNMEAVGYMLRGFFEGLRRHIAYEGTLLEDLPAPRSGHA